MSVSASGEGADERRPVRSVAEIFAPLGHYVWQGGSGRTFTHTVYSLLGCPAPIAASWVLVRRERGGRRHALATGRTSGDVASVNLAEIRRKGATLEADEVHLFCHGESASEHAVVAFDIAAGEGLTDSDDRSPS